MEKQLSALLDRDEIRGVLNLYCRAIDRRDERLLRSLFHPDATDDHIAVSGPSENFFSWVYGELAGDTFVMHNLGTTIIEIDGDVAHVESYYESVRGQPADVGEWLLMSGGRYIDRFERREGGPWLIASRTLFREWSRRDLIPPEQANGIKRGSSVQNVTD